MTSRQQKDNDARRRLLKSIVAGGGVFAVGRTLPASWREPVVKAVILPAHAQTSPFTGPTGNFGAAVAAGLSGSSESGPSILDMFVPPAHANSFAAKLGNLSFDAYWTVREDDAVICGEALHLLGNVARFIKIVGRSGDRLDDFREPVGDEDLVFTNQQVAETGVSLMASTDFSSGPFLAPPGGPGCDSMVSNSLKGTSSPYSEDDDAV